MSVVNPVLYVPVESQNRELDSKLLIAGAVAAAGVKVVLGWQRTVVTNFANLPPGMVLLKGLNKIQRGHMRRARNAGHLVTAIDEEGFAISDPECLLKDIDPNVAEFCHRVYAPHPTYRRVLLENRDFGADQVLVTGNPRTDLTRPPFSEILRDEADTLAAKHGPMVLVNSNTCAVNSAWGDLDRYFRVCAEIGWLDPNDPKGHQTFHDHVQHDQASFLAMREALELFHVALPTHDIVIRPHPSERFEPWFDRYDHRERFHVIGEGNNLAWIMAADLVLHTSCTTGSEAALMGRPVISLVPDGACVAHWYISNKVNPVARSPEEAADMARRYLVDGEDVFAVGRGAREANMREFFSLGAERQSHERIASDILGCFGRAIDRSYHWRIERLNVLQESIAESNKNDFDLAALEQRLDLLERFADGYKKPKARRVHDELFMLEARD